eukprot:TRINITY_DN66444_c11_g14_i1.p1 TRINITY_DN66444_c11_g14~~TRINITY_DN66444_c11_g14_i1.p1  ORF type:complete len:252 (-),score=21.31 TRINITY_DN66444_c11_g14_i1:111-866(-)
MLRIRNIASLLAGHARTTAATQLNYSSPSYTHSVTGIGRVCRWISLQSTPTPNPDCRKFTSADLSLMPAGMNYDFTSAVQASGCSLAAHLFTLPGVSGVHFGDDFLTITKAPEDSSTSWEVVGNTVETAVTEWIESKEPLFDDPNITNQEESDDTAPKEGDSDVVLAIKELLELKVRPKVKEDGGNIRFVEYDEEEGIVFLMLQGACQDCPSAGGTLHDGIERMLMHYIPEVTGVHQVTPHPFAFPGSVAE